MTCCNYYCLKDTIELLRSEMIRTGITEGLSSKKTLEISKKLDLYITQYQILRGKNNIINQ